MNQATVSLTDLKEEIDRLHTSLPPQLDKQYSVEILDELKIKFSTLSDDIRAHINPESIQHLDGSELELVEEIEKKYRQMLVVLKAQISSVSEELHKLKQRTQVQNVYK